MNSVPDIRLACLNFSFVQTGSSAYCGIVYHNLLKEKLFSVLYEKLNHMFLKGISVMNLCIKYRHVDTYLLREAIK